MAEEKKTTAKKKAVAPLEKMLNESKTRIQGLIIEHQGKELHCALSKDKAYEHEIVSVLQNWLHDIEDIQKLCVSRNRY